MMRRLFVALLALPVFVRAAPKYQWDLQVPLRDGVKLHASLYSPSPRDTKGPTPCIFTLTPYTTQSYHDRGTYYASHGLTYLVVDSRGRGDSEGQFRPFIQEARDGYDVTEWLARQPYCNGKVAMSGGSYTGYDQWATAKEFPPHLSTIVPTAAPYAGIDFPMRGGNFYPFLVEWLTLVGGHTLQGNVVGDGALWASNFREWFESGRPYSELDKMSGHVWPVFHEWLAHPDVDAYWDRYNPTAEQYAKLSLPILTITGSYDDDQPGAIQHYRQFMQYASAEARERHYLVIGPWDHAGTHAANAQVGGLTFGPASLLDIAELHVDWYAWTMSGGPKPDFLKQHVAYYVMGAEQWQYAPSLDAVTRKQRRLYLDSDGDATDVFRSGSLSESLRDGRADSYVYDPRDTAIAALEEKLDPSSLTDQSLTLANKGKLLVYHSEPLAQDTEVSGFFSLAAWISLDQPDTDFSVAIYEIRADGSAVLLTRDIQRARYREGPRRSLLINTREPLKYQFDGFTFVSRRVARGSRLRLVVAPVNSIYAQKNHNSGKAVANESADDSRPVTVQLFHDAAHPSVLRVPIGGG
jgi:putative CocE/NonD family hydrolase